MLEIYCMKLSHVSESSDARADMQFGVREHWRYTWLAASGDETLVIGDLLAIHQTHLLILDVDADHLNRRRDTRIVMRIKQNT